MSNGGSAQEVRTQLILPSRGIATTELCDNTLWWSGPGWLGPDENSEFSPIEMPLENMLELRTTPNTIELLITEKYSISNIIKITKYSDLSRLICITALILKAIHVFKKLHSSVNSMSDFLVNVERLWLLEVQSNLTDRKDFFIPEETTRSLSG